MQLHTNCSGATDKAVVVEETFTEGIHGPGALQAKYRRLAAGRVVHYKGTIVDMLLCTEAVALEIYYRTSTKCCTTQVLFGVWLNLCSRRKRTLYCMTQLGSGE